MINIIFAILIILVLVYKPLKNYFSTKSRSIRSGHRYQEKSIKRKAKKDDFGDRDVFNI